MKMKNAIAIKVDRITKHFQWRVVLDDVSFSLQAPGSLVITGPNGSGKTTLVRILAGLLSPTSGEINYIVNQQQRSPEASRDFIGLVGPYLQFYRDLSAWENMYFIARAKSGKADEQRIKALLAMVGLKKREHDLLKTYSSGMLQRMKYAAALYHSPEILILDEPTANLDDAGKKIVHEIIDQQKQQGIVIIATNEPEELSLGEQHLDVAQTR
jgi:heme exporter protein A